jgi:predicted nucleotidyltransferase
MTELADLKLHLRKKLRTILNDKPVQLVYLYGSMAEGYPLAHSDIDLALVLDHRHQLSPYQQMLLAIDISAQLEQSLPGRQIDIRFINQAPLMVQGRILTNGFLLYTKNEDFRVTYETLTRKQYFDFLPVVKMMQKAYFAHMKTDLKRKGLLADG